MSEKVKRYNFTAYPTHIMPSPVECDDGGYVGYADYDTMKTRLRALLVRWLEDPKSSREAIRLAIDTAKELEDSHG